MTRTAATVVLTPRQVSALASPARLEIVEAFGALGRASARELAGHLGRSPGAVYHHLRALEQAGIVRVVARRAGPRRPEAVYAAAAQRLAVAAGPSPAADAAMGRALTAVLRQAARDVGPALAMGREALLGRFHGLQLAAALSPEEFKRVLALLARIEAIFRRANKARSDPGTIARWTTLLTPIRRGRP